MAKKELEMYLSGSTSTGLLLLGKVGMPLKEDALFVASSLLNIEVDKLSLHPDYLFLDKGKEKSIGVDALGEVFSRASLKPSIANNIVIVIDGLDSMTVQAQNKLLKTLEENHTVIFIATGYSHSVIDTIKSRMRVIEYRALSEEEFLSWCQQNNIATPKEMFYVTGGNPGLIETYSEVMPVFLNLSKAFFERSVTEFFKILHLLKEKDKQNFYSVYPELVPNLFGYLGNLLRDGLFKIYGVEKTSVCPYNTEAILLALSVIEEQMVVCHKSSYQQNSFFLGIVKLVEALEGGVL